MKSIDIKPIFLSRFISGWIFFIAFSITAINKNNSNDPFYRIGPNENLVIFGVIINTWTKYLCIVLYCLINTAIRNAEQNILRTYITLHIQDDSTEAMIRKRSMNQANAYEITALTTLYAWFDWFMFIQILLTQVDMIIIEASTDIAVSLVITRWYLKKAEEEINPYIPI